MIHIQVACAIATFIIITDHPKPLAALPADVYTSRYDNFDINQVLRSERLLRNYANCILDKGSCTREGAELKKIIPDALISECSKCTQIQKEKAGQALAYILQNRRDIWDEFLNKYDPNGTFRAKYEVDDSDDDDDEEGGD